jgi:recombination protein RecR
MMRIPKAVKNLIDSFERLPGIGAKTAARLTFYLLHVPENERRRFGEAVLELGTGTKICTRCFNISEETLCDICQDGEREETTLCVVEDPLDLMAFERTGKYRGIYHVLQGAIAPLERVGPEDLKIRELMERIKSSDPAVKEVILATNPSLEGEATAMYIKKLLDNRKKGRALRVSRIARGVPTGGDLEYADELTLTKALEGRIEY